MNFGSEALNGLVNFILVGALIILAILVVLCLIRAVIGPRISDRVISINMMSTMVIVVIAILAIKMGEGYLVDICIIYAAISFLAVIVLTKVYTGAFLEAKEHKREVCAEAKEQECIEVGEQKCEEKSIVSATDAAIESEGKQND